MKKNVYILIYCLLFMLIISSLVMSCHDDLSEDLIDEEMPGEARPVGETIGSLYTQETGPEGGTIFADEDKISIKIPAGALDENVAIGVQEIETTNLAGIGKSYRLTPHDQEFKEPVEISFKYDETLEDAAWTLGIAYQDENNVWNYVADPVIDNGNKTVTVKSTHFSDWSIMAYVWLVPMNPSVKTGESVELKAVRFVFLDEDLLAPLVPNHEYAPIRKSIDLESKYIGSWTLAGEGDLAPNRNRATYSAPVFTPNNNPVAVSLQLKTSKLQVLLISNITILGGAVEFSINGGNLISLEASAVQLAPGHFGISSTSSDPGDGVLTMYWTGGVGTHAFTQAGDFDTNWGYTGPVGSNDHYGHTYAVGETQEPHISPGGITITSMGEKGGYVEGTFIITKSGHLNITSGQVGIVPIEGRFKVRRAF